MNDAVSAAAVAAVLCGVAGLFVPALIRGVPEPEPHPDDELLPGEDPDEPKVLYADLAAAPGLAWKAAVAALVVGGVVGWSVGWDWPLLFLLPLVPLGVALAVIDWVTRYLPTRLVAPAYVGTIVLVLVCWLITRDTDDLARAGLGWVIAGGLFLVMWLLPLRMVAYGDVRLSGVLGIALGYVGWGELLVGVYGGFLLGGIVGVPLIMLRVVHRKAVPFGPFMLVGAVVGIAVGADVLAYLVPAGP